MNKPDDVSAEAWEAAEVVAKEATRDAMRDPLMPYYITVTPHIARAIDAAIQSAVEVERRSIQTEVQDMAVPSAFSNSWQLGYRQCRIDVVDAIRRRKGA